MESTRIQSIAIQTGVAEDIEQRRRCMHQKEEALKQKGAEQVSSLVKTGLVSLNHVEPVIKSVPLSASDATRVQRNVRRAGRVAAVPFQKAADVASAATTAVGNALHAAAALPGAAVHKAVDAAGSAMHAAATLPGVAADTTANAAHKAAGAASDVGHATANATNTALNKASDLGHATANTAASAAHATGNAASTAAHAAGNAIYTAATLPVVAASTAAHVAGNAASAAGNAASTAALATGNAASTVAHATGNAASTAAHAAGNAASTVAHATGNAIYTAATLPVVAAHMVANTTANVAHVTADAASTVGHVAANTASTVGHVAADIGSAAAHTAANLGSAAAHVAANTVVGAANMAVGAGQVAANTAVNAANMAVGAGQVAANTAVNAAHMAAGAGQAAAEAAAPVVAAGLHATADAIDAGTVAAQEAAEAAKPVAKSLFSKAVDLGYRAAGFGTAVASSALHAAADVGTQVLHTAGDYANHYMTSAHRTFLRGQEEIERLRRQTSEEEHWAILNAFKAAQCIRGWLASENLMLPLAGRHVEAYWVKLLEEVERVRRLASPVSAKKNATKLANLFAATHFPRNALSADNIVPSFKLNHVTPLERNYVPVAEDLSRPTEIPKSVPVESSLPVEESVKPAIEDLHVPASAVNAAPFVPSSAQPAQMPVTYYPVPVTANDGSFAIPQLDLASVGANGAPIHVVYYPVLAQAAPLEKEASSETSQQPTSLGRAAM